MAGDDDSSDDESAKSGPKKPVAAAGPAKPPPRPTGPKKPGDMKWADFPALGNVVEGTRFICFKAPLDRALPSNPDHGTFTSPQLILEHIPARGRTLGMVIDLTDTYRFYSPYDAFESKQIKHFKLFNPPVGEIPDPLLVEEFNEAVTQFLKKTRGVPDVNGQDTLIGVHCQTGVNRTGYFVCQYMIQMLDMPPARAVKAFDDARGCKIESKDVLKDLYNLNAPKAKAAGQKKSVKK